MKTKKYSAAELADAHIFPHGLTDEQKMQADKELFKMRAEKWNNKNNSEILRSKLLQLKYQLEDSIVSLLYDSEMNFGYFLSKYIQLINKKQKDFAKEISLDEARLSRIIHGKEFPNEELFIRLELHSNNIISALSWFKIVEKEKAYILNTNIEMRQKEKKYVHKTLCI